MITNLAVLEDGEKVIHRLSTSYPQYSVDETDNKIQHFLKSGTKPINCKTIYDKGFKCPKINDCECKSPASFIYIPMDIEVLKEILKEIPINNSSKDIPTAAKFIEDYMYNTEDVEAEPFISIDMKNYFRFKNDFVRTLIKKYREVYKNYKKSRKIVQSTDMPWYISTDKGTKFVSGVLASYLNENVPAFYGAEDYFLYMNGVYKQVKSLEISRVIRKHIVLSMANMTSINK